MSDMGPTTLDNTDILFGRRGLKRFLPRKLFARTLLIIMLPVIIAQGLATWIFFSRHLETTTRRLAGGVAGDIAVIIELLERDRSPDGVRETLASAARMTDLIVTLEPGAVLPDPKPIPRGAVQRELASALEDRVRRPFVINTEMVADSYEIRVAVPGGVMSVISEEKRLFNPTTIVFLIWMMGSAAVLTVVSIVFMRNQIRPVLKLAEAAESFGKGRDVPNFKPVGALEVRRAAVALLRMRDRLRAQINQRTAMLAGVSHDLRTPLTRMRLALDMMPEGLEIEELRDDVDEMETMIEGYLAFVRGEGEEPTVILDLSRLLEEIVAAGRREGGVVHLSAPEGLTLPARRAALRRCLANLVSNARRHARSAVDVSAEAVPGAIVIRVDDDGPGIPSERREDVFKPFFRLDASRNLDEGGVGLGLTIARDVARGHGGTVTLDDSPAGGLRVVVRLPL